MKIDVTTLEAKKAGSVDLTDEVFALEPRTDILHRMVAWQLAKRQAGTHKTKGRSEIALT
ncbi:MAG: 50S ribosomal protein L4, partial [Parvibaculum sp.]|nr:50S ribosomal protein L4 [Parvibaculum sp.]